jgi:hypothetical protein
MKLNDIMEKEGCVLLAGVDDYDKDSFEFSGKIYFN